MESAPNTWQYGQPWLSQTEPDFATGHVTFGLSEDALVIRAELTDAHPIQDVFVFNFPAFTKCDAFDIFLGPADEKACYELHVTPSNRILQLYFDGTDAKKTLADASATSLLDLDSGANLKLISSSIELDFDRKSASVFRVL